MDHFSHGPNLIQIISGPRQVGKTTAIHHYMEEVHWPYLYETADLLAPPSTQWIEQHWIKARELAKTKGNAILILDEIQKINRWSEAVKRFHDEDVKTGCNLRVVLLGSSALLMQKGLTESLAGRFEIIPFTHWTFSEASQAFSITLDDYIFFGGYPGALGLYCESKDENRWQHFVHNALIEPVIGKDILLLQTIEKPALLRQIFRLAAAHPAEILSLNKMLGQLDDTGNTTTIASYLQTLSAAGLIASIQKYSGSKIRQRTSSPKLIFLNNALINATMLLKFSDAYNDSAYWGRLIENAAGAHLINTLCQNGISIYYWRERNEEIDFIIEKGRTIIGIEIKSGCQKGKHRLPIFQKRFSPDKMIIIGGDNADIDLQTFFSQSPRALLGL